MEEQILGVTRLINWLFGKPVTVLLSALRIRPEHPEYPIPNYVAMEIVVFLVAAVFFLWLRRRLSAERPGAIQQSMELLITNPMAVGVRDLLEDIAGHGTARYMPMLGSIGIFVLFSNLISILPAFSSPTAAVSVPFGCAVLVFLYYNYCGIRHHGGLGYAKQFLGPVPAMAILMLPIELVSHSARLLSLTVRLWVNMLVSELLYVTFLGLTLTLFLFVKNLSFLGYVLVPVPLVVPLIFIGLHIFVGVLQAFVFTLLPVIYVGGAVAEEH